MKAHWENIYSNKGDLEVSWYQEKPETSLKLINKSAKNLTDKIIDVGAGNSNLIIELVKLGYADLTALDISKHALERTQNKLGEKSNKVKWIIEDITSFGTDEKFDVWHDRAVFHFLTEQSAIEKYSKLVSRCIPKDGKLILSTFSENGPLKCSGLEISQYNKEGLIKIFGSHFELLECHTEDHTTPFDTTQNFIYTVFKRK